MVKRSSVVCTHIVVVDKGLQDRQQPFGVPHLTTGEVFLYAIFFPPSMRVS